MIIVGIDWSKSKHDVHIVDPQGRDLRRLTVEHSADGLERLAHAIAEHQPRASRVRVAVEMHDGALLAWLLERGYTVYGINPKAAERARDRHRPGGGKSDKLDAFVIADMLRTDAGVLRPIQPASDATRRLRRLVSLRREHIQGRTACVQRLRDRLDQWCPQLSGVCNDLNLKWQRDLLDRFPLQQDLHEAHGNTLRAFVRKHRLGKTTARRLTRVRQATPLSIPRVERPTLRLDIQFLLRQIELLSQIIRELDEKISQAVGEHPDASIFQSLPVRADNTVAHLLAGFGEDRGRDVDHHRLAAQWGVAPLTITSGQHRHVRHRFAADAIMKQAMTFFAFNTAMIDGCWAADFYRRKRREGKAHYTALRCLAQRWIKILTRLWRDRVPYDEQRHRTNIKTPPKAIAPT